MVGKDAQYSKKGPVIWAEKLAARPVPSPSSASFFLRRTACFGHHLLWETIAERFFHWAGQVNLLTKLLAGEVFSKPMKATGLTPPQPSLAS